MADDDFARAVNFLEDAVSSAVARAQQMSSLSNNEAAEELRRIAASLEEEKD